MENRDRQTHLRKLSALFRERRFGEAMEYLSRLGPEERDRICRTLGEKGLVREEPRAS